ncbi:MAG TPA: hypothetical protein PK765_02415 [bacterium]|nr:hypothetical protein [bacterium]
MIETFAQKRLIDGLEYHFVLDGEYNGRPAYIRMDGQVLYRWHDRS